MKLLLLIFLFTLSFLLATAQIDTSESKKNNRQIDTVSARRQNKPTLPKPATQPIIQPAIKKDTSFRDSLNIDSLLTDTISKSDTLKKVAPHAGVKKFIGIDSNYAHFLQNPFLPMQKKPVYQIAKVRIANQKDELFYLIAGLVFYLGCIKWMFHRYYDNLFRLFFQPSFRQKQTREQLMQNNFPSLLLNFFFILSGGTFVSLLVVHYQIIFLSFWNVLLYAVSGLAILYALKYLFIIFSGWVFNVKEAASTYIFAVYLVNKILGILLVPFIFLLAFASQQIIEISITISVLIIILIFLYRYIISYNPVRREVKVSPLHFILYILAFEILPLLFIYKSLILYLNRTL